MSERYTATGTVLRIDETKQVSEKFRKREFVLTIEDGKYPQTVLFQLTGDRCESLDQHGVGDELRVEFNLRGREWTNREGVVKVFNSLDVWKVEATGNKTEVYEPPADDTDSVPF